MPDPKYTLPYTGKDVADAIAKALPLETFEHISDESINGTTYHVLWKITPTANNQVSGFSIHPLTGKLCEIYSNNGALSTNFYLSEGDVITTAEIDALFN